MKFKLFLSFYISKSIIKLYVLYLLRKKGYNVSIIKKLVIEKIKYIK